MMMVMMTMRTQCNALPMGVESSVAFPQDGSCGCRKVGAIACDACAFHTVEVTSHVAPRPIIACLEWCIVGPVVRLPAVPAGSWPRTLYDWDVSCRRVYAGGRDKSRSGGDVGFLAWPSPSRVNRRDVISRSQRHADVTRTRRGIQVIEQGSYRNRSRAHGGNRTV
jgi:hypothetical protein